MKLRKKTTWRPQLEFLEARRLLSVFADFNRDGFGDLAVGVPGENNSAGAVNVIYGSLAGLAAKGKFTPANQLWTMDNVGLASEPGEQFGRTLAAGDFNGDGFADLAIGVPFEKVLLPNTGFVCVLYGSAGGLTTTNVSYWDVASLGKVPNFFGGDQFGAALAVGDFDNDGFDDLVVGTPGANIGPLLRVGNVHVIYGSNSGLTSAGNQKLNQTGFTDGVSESNDVFGAALAAGDFDGDGFDDLAVGVPGEDTGLFKSDAGGVNVIYGSANGLTDQGDQFWEQDSSGIQDEAEASDFFGDTLAAGDFNGDTFFDLAIGIPFEDVSDVSNAGAVAVLYGGSGGLSSVNDQFFNQATAGLAGTIAASDQFGSALTAGDFNGNGRDDLAIGVSRDDIDVADGGAVHVLYGGSVTLSTAGSQFLRQGMSGIEDTPEASDRYGYLVGTGDFDGDGKNDLAIGVLNENGAGAVNAIYGTAAGFSFANDQLWSQNSTDILDTSEPDDNFGGGLVGGSGVDSSGFSGAWKDLTQKCKNDKCKLKGTLEVTNPGIDVASASVVKFYLSDDATFSRDDLLVQETALKPLAPQEKVNVRLRVKLPKGQTATGKYLIAVLDANNDVFEVNEENNIIVFGPIA